jgi:thiol-disulfide isomerase/thioredoxin
MRRILVMLLLVAAQGAYAATAQFELQGLDGRQHSLADYRGKWVLVNYWATWCPPCREELPELEVFYSNHKDTAVVLGVNMEDIDTAKLRHFVEEQFLSYPILRGTRAAANALGPVPGLPTTYVVSPAGDVVARQVGPVTAEGISRFIDNYRPVEGHKVSLRSGQ